MVAHHSNNTMEEDRATVHRRDINRDRHLSSIKREEAAVVGFALGC